MKIRRVVWFMALIFPIVILIWYFKLPYGYISSSLLSFGKSQATSQGNDLNSRTDDKPFNISSGVSDHILQGHNNYSYIISPIPSPQVKDHSEYLATNISDFSDFFNISSTKRFKGQPKVVVSISAMNDMMHQSRSSYDPPKPKWASQGDEELLNARKLVEGARIMEEKHHIDINVYRNYSEFLRSYELMEQTLKVYVYAEGERPVFHQPELHGLYASESWFMKQLEENEHFVTTDADKAHLFYLPFSSRMLVKTLYVPDSHSHDNMVRYLSSYLYNITKTYRFWNRTDGADHFLVACHDWAPFETNEVMKNCIRALCNADVEGEFKFGKDVSLPEISIRDPKNPLKSLGGHPPSERRILAFFAGKTTHGYLRSILSTYWGDNKDPDMKIFGKLHRHDSEARMSYTEYMKSSRYCLCAKGYEVNSPRLAEAIFYECVPVIISDNFVPPFFGTLNWESFAVFVMEKDIPDLKSILLSISDERYLEMQERVRKVQKHFLWHDKPVKFDVFHMILHSIWYTRVFQMKLG